MTSDEQLIKVGIVEDDPRIGELLQLLINNSPGFEASALWSSAESFLNDESDGLSIVLMDIDLPGISGIDCVTKMQHEDINIPVVMLTVHEDDEAIFESLKAGAIGYLVKGLPPVKLLEGIRDGVEGGSPMSPSIARRVINSFKPEDDTNLSDRERQVLKCLCDGSNYKDIGEQLFISSNTVKAHIKSIYQKLHVNSRAEVVATAIRKGLI